MKNGTLYAKRVKKFFSQLKSQFNKPDIPEPDDPVNRMMIGVLASDIAETDAAKAVARMREAMVDINEIRVSTSSEIATAAGNAKVADRADQMRRALNAVFQKEHAVTLEHLIKMGRRDAKQYLENLDGMDACSVAHVILWSLGGHAIPVDERMFALLKREELVDPDAAITDVQAFLERNINASDGKLFCLLMQQAARTKATTKKSTGKTVKSKQAVKSSAKSTTKKKSSKSTAKRASKTKKVPKKAARKTTAK